MPRAALLSIHARVEGAHESIWEHPSLVQIWGPRFSDYVIAAKDLPIFSLGRLPSDSRRLARARETALRLQAFLEGRRMPFGQAGRALGVQPNSLRYAAPTGTVLLRWDGIRQPLVWCVPQPEMDPHEARLELARRYLHIFGPASFSSFARWAGVKAAEANAASHALARSLTPVRTLVGDGFVLNGDEAEFVRPSAAPPAAVRFLPSGDAYYLLWDADRELLVPQPEFRAELWTTRVWPGALLVKGEIVGVWRRSGADISIRAWRRLSTAEWEAVEAEAVALPLPGLKRRISIHRE